VKTTSGRLPIVMVTAGVIALALCAGAYVTRGEFARANSEPRSVSYYVAHPGEEAEALARCDRSRPLLETPAADCAAARAADAEIHRVHNDRRKFLTGTSGTAAAEKQGS
jgi:hypothetical protein